MLKIHPTPSALSAHSVNAFGILRRVYSQRSAKPYKGDVGPA